LGVTRETETLLDEMGAMRSSSFGRYLLTVLAGAQRDSLEHAADGLTQLLGDASRSMLTFYALGWAPNRSEPSSVYSAALKVLDAGGSVADAEQVLVRGWNEGHVLNSLLKRLLSIGSGDSSLTDAARARYRLVLKALEHHRNGAYEASIPIVLAQSEGIIFDVTDGNFGLFSRLGNREHLSDDTTLAGLAVGVSALQKLIAAPVNETGSTGRLARHGIMHGRELGYDTPINSTKAFVFLISIIELAQPRARALSDARRQAEFEKWAGSDELDEDGARRDRRGFDHAKRVLRNISTRMIAEYRRQHRYPSLSLEVLFPGETGDQLVDTGRSRLVVANDGRSYYAYHETPTGHFFGLACVDQHGLEHRYFGNVPPRGGIGEDDWRGVLNPSHPDWTV